MATRSCSAPAARAEQHEPCQPKEPRLVTFASDRVGLGTVQARAGFDPLEAYCSALLIALAGYAILGKGFAYLGAPPLFVGEMMLALGLAVIYRTGCGFALFSDRSEYFLAVAVAARNPVRSHHSGPTASTRSVTASSSSMASSPS